MIESENDVLILISNDSFALLKSSDKSEKRNWLAIIHELLDSHGILTADVLYQTTSAFGFNHSL